MHTLDDLSPYISQQLSSQQWIYQVLESMSDGVWICDATPSLLWINKACEELNGIKRDQVCNKSVQELLGMGNFDTDVTHSVLESKESCAIIQKVQSGRTLLVSGVPIFDEQGEICLVVGTERDLTELNLLREQLDASSKITERFQSALTAMSIEKYGSENLIAFSEPMNRLLETCTRVAGFDTTLLLTGESGTGKSMIAGFIHKTSARSDKPLMSLNCGAIPGSLVEAELFGYADGAFTGSQKGGKPGLFEAADGGTLFLDEVDSFSLELQVKLLTFLDTQSFIRVGGTKVKQVDVRLIVATNQNLQEKVEAGEFRADLFYRLNVLPLNLPPLRDRTEDIPLLIKHILGKLSTRYKQQRKATPDLIDALERYRFPGNVRELENILERSFVLSHSDAIGLGELPPEFKESILPQRQNDDALPYKLAMQKLERQYLEQARDQCRSQQEMASFLNVSQPTVARLLKKHNFIHNGIE